MFKPPDHRSISRWLQFCRFVQAHLQCSHDKSSSTCMRALVRSRAARTRNTDHRDCSQRAPAVNRYCLVDLHKLSALNLPPPSLISRMQHHSTTSYTTTAHLTLQKCPPQHLSLQTATPPSALSYACGTETTPSSPVTQHSRPQPALRDLQSQNTPPQHSPKPTLS